jgi:uncharacterized protein (TIGR02118 family)
MAGALIRSGHCRALRSRRTVETMRVVIKRLTFWRRREGMSRDAALACWRESHIRLVGQIPGVKAYRQDHCTPGPDGAEPPYVGVGELAFGSMAEASNAMQTWISSRSVLSGLRSIASSEPAA